MQDASTQSPAITDAPFGVVVIGRNEGERLRRCLLSLRSAMPAVVYVDSGSSDGSVAMAQGLGAQVCALDMTQPFTAARARNAGVRQLMAFAPHAQLIQFVDGDCEVAEGWLATARAFIASRADVAVVCGRRRERHPGLSVYNLLCDIEWATPIGEAKACGGDALVRVSAFQQVGGFRESLIAGEEPELCVRLRAQQWKIWRLDAEMTWHDAAMTRIGQWWQRCVRAGFAYAEGARLHGAPPERHWVREARSACLWAGALPAVILTATAAFGPPAALALAIFPLQMLRLYMQLSGSFKVRGVQAFFLVAGKFPELIGVMRSVLLHRRGLDAKLIEYK